MGNACQEVCLIKNHELINFTNLPLSDRNLEYGGRAGEKRGVIFYNSFWFLKFPKNTLGMDNIKELSYVTSPLSEYIGCHIYKILGYDVQETVLGYYDDGRRKKIVCACKDFIEDDRNEKLIPYTSLRNDTSDVILERNSSSSTLFPSNLDEIIFQLENNTILKEIKGAKERFFDCLVIDILINNNDRNEDIWGVIKNKVDNSYRMAPIYDCGNSFYSKNDETKISNLLNDDLRLLSSSLNGITAYGSEKDKKYTVTKILTIENEDLQKSMVKIYKLVNEKIDEIKEFIMSIPESFDGIPVISKNRKIYYLETFNIRFRYLLETEVLKMYQQKKVSF